MADMRYAIRSWNDMDIDVLAKIFENLNIFELTDGIPQVCRTWRLAACDPFLWKTIDLSMLKSYFIKLPSEPYVYVADPSEKLLTRVLKVALNISCGNLSTLILHYDLYISDKLFTYTAERCPNLKRLVMPAWDRIKKPGICRAFQRWQNLESLTMRSISNPPSLIEEISKNCKKFSELKIMGDFDIFFASTLNEFLPNLKVLSLRCCHLHKDALIAILEGLKGLEVLNISHSLIVELVPPHESKRVLKELDPPILERASRLKKFITCMENSCVTCRRMRDDKGYMRWYKYEEDLWKVDEIVSLAV